MTEKEIEKLLDYYHNGPQGHNLYHLSQSLRGILSDIKHEVDCIYDYADYVDRRCYGYSKMINDQELRGYVRRALKLLGCLKEKE